MRGFLKSSKKLTVILCLVLVLGLGFVAERVYAYFTTYATAQGTVPISLGAKTEITEEFSDWKKTITIQNTGDALVFIRVKVLCGQQFTVTASGENWTLEEDGYYYFSNPVLPGESTDTIVAAIEKSKDVISDFNIIVVQECIPAMYDENGNPQKAQNATWNKTMQYEVDSEGNIIKEAE